jgi:hypothetical protein
MMTIRYICSLTAVSALMLTAWMLCAPAPAHAEVKISITPQGDLPWSEYTEIVIKFDMGEQTKTAWREVQEIVYKLDDKNITTQLTNAANTINLTSTVVKVTAPLQIKPGQHTLTVSLTPGQGPSVQASTLFNLIDQGGTKETAEEFFGAAPYMLWPDQAPIQARAGRVALEGSFMFNISGAMVVDAGFKVDGVDYHSEPTGIAYYAVLVDLPEGVHTVEAFIIDSAGYTYLSDPCEMTLSNSAAAHAYPTHAPTPVGQFSNQASPALLTSGGLPTQQLLGRFHLVLEADGPGPDPFAPGNGPPIDDGYSFSWMTYSDACGSFENCAPMVWRGDSFAWEYKFERGDWQYHHMKLTGEVSSDGRTLKKLAFVDRYEAPRGSTVYSELTFTLVDVPLTRKAPAGLATVPLGYAAEGKRWAQYLIAFEYDYFDSANTRSETHYKLADIERARAYAGFW